MYTHRTSAGRPRRGICRCWLLLLLAAVSLAGHAVAQDAAATLECGDPFANGVGPYDYTNALDRAQHIGGIERHHFNADVQALRGGQTSAYIMTDLDYMLRAVPNHHQALAALARYAPQRLPQEADFMATECYFVRAVVFRPDDPVVRAAYGVYLTQVGRLADAEKQYLEATRLDDSYAEAHYNLGLLYVERGDIERARLHADRAYALGFPLPGLQRKLQRLGRAANRP